MILIGIKSRDFDVRSLAVEVAGMLTMQWILFDQLSVWSAVTGLLKKIALRIIAALLSQQLYLLRFFYAFCYFKQMRWQSARHQYVGNHI